MRLIKTTNKHYEYLKNKECSIDFYGFCLYIHFGSIELKTSTVLKIERKDDLLEVYTKNNIYIFDIN